MSAPPEHVVAARAWDAAEAKERLFGLVHDGPWFHVSNQNDLAENELLLAERRLA